VLERGGQAAGGWTQQNLVVCVSLGKQVKILKDEGIQTSTFLFY